MNGWKYLASQNDSLKNFFGIEKDLYLCAVYIPPFNSVHSDEDFLNLENEIALFSTKGEIALIGDFNSRVGNYPDFAKYEANDTNLFQDILPPNYDEDCHIQRYNQDKI